MTPFPIHSRRLKQYASSWPAHCEHPLALLPCRNSMEALFNAVCDTLPANIWSPTTGALRAASSRLLNWRDDSLVGLAALAREYTGWVRVMESGCSYYVAGPGACNIVLLAGARLSSLHWRVEPACAC